MKPQAATDKQAAPDKQAATDQEARAKKPYSTPTLRVYGRLQDLTKASANDGLNTDIRGAIMDLRTH
jgi:hypothetical protein